MQSMNQAMAEIQNSIQITGQIQTYLDGEDAKKALNLQLDLQKMFYDVQSVWIAAGSTEQKRFRLSSIRRRLSEIRNRIERLTDNVVKKYRKALGDGKDAFEELTLYYQQQHNPKAFQLLQTYHLIKQLDNYLSDVNASLMDYNMGLERQERETQQSQSRYTPVEEASASFIADHPDNFADDPAPHHLSP